MSNYVRQSAASIIPGEIVAAAPLNAEFNQLQAAFSGTSGHGHTGASGDGPPLDMATSTTGNLPVNRGGTGATSAAGARTNLSAQQQDPLLDSIAGLTTAADKGFYTSALDVAGTYDLTFFGRSLGGYANAAAFKTGVNLTPGVDIQSYDAGLTALAAFNTNGIVVQTADNTFAGRTITGTTNQITVTNGSGVSGNPTLGLAGSVAFPGGMVEKTVTVADTTNTGFASQDANIVYLVATGNRNLSISDTPASGQKFIIFHTAVGADRTLSLDTNDFAFQDGITSLEPTLSGYTDVIGAIYHAGIGKALVVAQVSGFI